MYAQFTYCDGPSAGQARVVGHDFATIGRDPRADVPVEAERYPEVSIRHAAVFKQGGGYLVRDLGSTNGTFVNGERVRGDRPIEVGDRIRLGPGGPEITFGTSAAPPHVSRGAGATPRPRPGLVEIHQPRQRATARVGRPRTGRRRWIAAALALVLAGAGGASAFAYHARQQAEALAARRDAIQRRLDDVRNRLDAAVAPNDGLRTAIGEARSGLEALRSEVASAPTDSALSAVEDRIGTVDRQVEPVLRAVATNPATGRAAAGGRVAAVIGEFGRGAVQTASAVAILRAGDTTWYATHRTVAVDSAGVPAVRFAVIADGGRVASLGRLLKVDDSTGVAIVAAVRADAAEPLPAGSPPAPGAPVIQVGFPFGADSLGDWRTTGAAARAAVGTIKGADSLGVTVTGYGGGAWPGSALVSAAGTLVGMIDAPGPNGDLRAIPIARLRRLVVGRP